MIAYNIDLEKKNCIPISFKRKFKRKLKYNCYLRPSILIKSISGKKRTGYAKMFIVPNLNTFPVGYLSTFSKLSLFLPTYVLQRGAHASSWIGVR